MEATAKNGAVEIKMSHAEALVCFELLQRLVEENEEKLLPLLKSSAEFAVLCRLNNHLEKLLSEPFADNYDELLAKARALLIRESGRYIGIEEA